ncbi:hypothetical protein V8E54_013170, partial [Elaphomyces granulatus]
MALVSIEPLQCFTIIKNNLPAWVSRVSGLTSYISTKQAEDAAKGAPAPNTRNRVTEQAPNKAIYYDGYIQKELVHIVHDIGSARNRLRRGKMTQRMKGPPSAWKQKNTPFDFADNQLELAQSFCEAAAFQCLRCGDCTTELETVEQKFRLVLEATESEIERLRREE